METIKQFKFTISTFVVWVLFVFWSSWFTNKCIEGIYQGCERSSGFVESFSVINLAAMFVFFPVLVISIIWDCK